MNQLFLKSEFLKDKGEKVGASAFLAKQYDTQDLEVDPWLDAVSITFYKWLKNPRFIIVEFQLVAVWNDKTKATFRYPEQYIAQFDFPLNGLTHKAFFEKYNQDLTFIEKYSKQLQVIVDENKEEIDQYRQTAKMMANN